MTTPRPADADMQDLSRFDADLQQSTRRSLIIWAIRWLIGFGLIWAITAWTERHGWLWTAGLVIASLSLAVTLGTQLFLSKKIAAVQAKRKDLDTLLEEDPDDPQG